MFKPMFSITVVALCLATVACKSDTKAAQADAAAFQAEIEEADSTSAVLQSVEEELDARIESATEALNALEE